MNVNWLSLVTNVFVISLALVDRSNADTQLYLPPPESPLDCHFEDDYCGWHPAGTDYFQWLRRGFIGNLTKDLYSPTEGYLSYKYTYVDSNLCPIGQTVCQAALVSVPIILNSSDVNPVSSLNNHSFSGSNISSIPLDLRRQSSLSNDSSSAKADWCFEFYYFITNNRTLHDYDLDLFLDKPPDLTARSNQHSVVVSENPEWTLSSEAAQNPWVRSAGQWRHITVPLKLGNGMHQLTLLAHMTKSSSGYDSPDNNIILAVDGSRLYKGQCVDLFEQDILTMTYNPQGVQAEDSSFLTQVHNAAVLNDMNIWPRGVIPYSISDDFTIVESETIRKSMNEFEKATCIRFRVKTTETNYLDITKGSWCYSFAGRVLRPEKQPLALHSSCLNFGTVLHELNHAVGFYHEHSRYDRDDHVNILWDNIAPGSSNQFQKYTLDQVDHLGLPYDYESVMHYSRTAYARLPGLTTIEPKIKGSVIGQRERLSDLDVRKINKKYKCPDGRNPIDFEQSQTLNCNFDNDFCDWIQPPDNDPQWTIFDPDRAHFEAPISAAASTNGMADIGRRSAVVDMTGASQPVRIVSPMAYTSGCFSLAFFFSRHGRKALRAILIERNSSTETVVWQMRDNGDSSVPVWRRGKFSTPLSNFKIAIEAEPLGNGQGSIAVDDFNFTSTQSDCAFMPSDARPTVSNSAASSSSAFELNCTFERSDFCGWINVRQVDEFDWVLNSGRTLTPFTGPAFDRTLGRSNPWGIYAYAPAVNKSPGNTARLVSPALTGYSSVCLRFYYLMYGNAMGTLRIYKRLIGGRNSGDVLSWEISGNQGTNWQMGDVRMAGGSQEVFQLVFEASVGQGAQSDIAIDDISVTFDDACSSSSSSSGYVTPDAGQNSNIGDHSRPVDDIADPPPDDWNYRPPRPSTPRTGSLSSGQFLGRTTALGRVSPPTFGRVSSYNPYPNRGQDRTTKSQPSNQQVLFCNFDATSLCNWVQDESQDDFDWQLNRGLTPSRNTGPMADHTTGSSSGSYLYLEASSPRRMGDLARLKSPLITNQPLTGCFHFWYSMYGSGIGELRILSTSAADGSRRLLWRLVGEQGPDWLRGQVWIDLEPSGGKIFIEGIVGQSYLADIAIDDLSFTSENCETVPQHAGMMPEEETNGGTSDEQRDALLAPSDDTGHSLNSITIDDAGQVDVHHPISTCSFTISASCSWQFVKDGDAFWYHSRTYPLQGTSPRGNRYPDYIYILSDWLQPWRSVSLVSPFVDLDTPVCIKLNYFMTSSSDNLTVKLRYADGSEDLSITIGSGSSSSTTNVNLLSSSGDYPEWRQLAKTLIATKPGSFKVVVLLRHGQAWNGAIGIESVRLLTGSC